jgi:hypothetical protein
MLHTAVVLALAVSGGVPPHDDDGTGWAPTLVVRAVSSWPEGTQTSHVSDDQKLVKGKPAAVTIWTGRSLCTIGIGGGEPMAAPAPPANVWRMTGDYLGEQNGRHQLRVTAGFTRVAGGEPGAMNTQTFSLREGDSVVLDALTERAEAGCPVRIVTFEARLAMQATDPALARARYTADMWLVHTGPDGQEQREHLVMNVDGSLVVPFMFNRLAFPIPQVDPRQGNAEAVIQLTGALRARPRPDGSVDLDIETNRLLFGLENPDGPIRSVPTTVRKTLTMKENETTAVDFPPPASGYASLLLDSSLKDANVNKVYRLAVRPGKPARYVLANGTVEAKDGRLVLNTASFFKGHKTQMLITLKPLR